MPFTPVHARLRPLALVAALSLGVAPIVATPATATPPAAVASVATPVASSPTMVTAPVAMKAPAKVVIKKIPTKTAPYGGKAKIKPRVTKTGTVKVTSKTLTVKKSGTTIAKNKKKVALKPGTYRVTTTVTFKRYTVKSTASGTAKVYGPKKTKKLTQQLVVKQGKRPSRTAPTSKWKCPSWAPIKGNQSGIYHLPGGRYYNITTPEECFTTASAARNAGYRASKNG